jgi:hypothetical protein
MMRALAILVLLAPTAAHAQLGRALGDPSPPPSLAHELGDPSEAPPTPPPTTNAPIWPGPQIQLAYDFYRVSDGYGGGDVHAAQVEIFVQLPIREIRLGALGEIGTHGYSLGGDDFLVRAGVEIGAQLPGWIDPIVPFASVLLSIGGIIGQRFETTVADFFGGGGIALGAELRLYRNLHVSLSGAYQRLEMDGAAFDVLMLRLALGL